MPDAYGPFDGAPWAEAKWFRFATRWAPDGILDEGDLPLTTSGLTLTLGVGRAWVGGAGFERTTPPGTNGVTPNSHSTFSRRDRLVLRRSLSTHQIAPFVIEGTPAANPVAPDPSLDEGGDYDLLLWSFLVPPNNGTAITGLVDERVISRPRLILVQTSEPAEAPEGALWFQLQG